jgi:hypothetical protein
MQVCNEENIIADATKEGRQSLIAGKMNIKEVLFQEKG